MSSDSRNDRQGLPQDIVPLNSADTGMEIEQKLAAARRLFSLHEYALCEQLVHEILAVDPHNSKAKALFDLTSIKLSKRKFYKKMVEPRLPDRQLEPPAKADSSTGDLAGRIPLKTETPGGRGTPVRPLPDQGLQSRTRSRTPIDRHAPSIQSEGAGDQPFAESASSIREQTISALVELLKDRNKGLGEWKDSRFEGKSSTQGGDESATPVTQGREVDASLSILAVPLSEAKAKTESPDSLEVAQPQSPLEQPIQNLPGEEGRQATNFLPAALVELFDASQGRREEPLSAAKTPTANVELNLAGVSPIPGEGLASIQSEDFTPLPSAVPPVVLPGKEDAALQIDKRIPIAPNSENVGGSVASPFQSPQESKQRIIQLPDVNVFERITPAQKAPPHELIERKLEQRSEEIRNSEVQAVSIAQIKKYLYQEEYDLCAQELVRIRRLFPQSAEIQAFAENTSRRLGELKAMKNFEGRAKEFMRTAVSFYQEGKLGEALKTAQRVLQVNPHHTQAREFVEFVERRVNLKRKKKLEESPKKYCKTCGTIVDSSSQFCHHCGKRLAI